VQAQAKILKEEVDDEDVAEIVSKWTGIPVSRMLEGEKAEAPAHGRPLRMRVAARTRRLPRSPMPCDVPVPASRSLTGPSAAYIFMGPTGVGKTELARAPREFPLDDEQQWSG